MNLRARILDYLRNVGPSSAALIAADLGVEAVPVNKALNNMAKLGTVERIDGKPLRFRYVREPIPFAEVSRMGREALKPINEARRVPPEQRKADNARRNRDRYLRCADRLNAQRRERRRAAPRQPKPARQQPAVVKRPRVVTDIAMAAPVALTHARVELPKIDTDAFIRANPDRYQVIPMDAPWRSAETLSPSHRKTIEGVR